MAKSRLTRKYYVCFTLLSGDEIDLCIIIFKPNEQHVTEFHLHHIPEQFLCLCTSSLVPKYNDSFPVAPLSLWQRTDQLSEGQMGQKLMRNYTSLKNDVYKLLCCVFMIGVAWTKAQYTDVKYG